MTSTFPRPHFFRFVPSSVAVVNRPQIFKKFWGFFSHPGCFWTNSKLTALFSWLTATVLFVRTLAFGQLVQYTDTNITPFSSSFSPQISDLQMFISCSHLKSAVHSADTGLRWSGDMFDKAPWWSSNHPFHVVFLCLYVCYVCVCIIHFVLCVPEIGSPNPSSG